MAYMNVSAPSDWTQLNISSTLLGTTGTWVATATNVITVPALQDITVTNNNIHLGDKNSPTANVTVLPKTAKLQI